jgi:hypothetical protein
VAAVLGYLRELQRAHGLAVVVVHHARKNGGSTGGQSLRGSSDFFAWVDTALSLRRHRQQLLLSAEQPAATASRWRSSGSRFGIRRRRGCGRRRSGESGTRGLEGGACLRRCEGGPGNGVEGRERVGRPRRCSSCG